MKAGRATKKRPDAKHRGFHHKVARHLKNHFIPHEGNDYTPHLLKHRALLAYSGVLIATKAALIVVGIAFPSASLYSFAISETSIVSLTNEARAGAGLPPVSVNGLLRGAAQQKADDMVLRNYFSHEGPEGESPWIWLNQSGYRYSAAGENLAIHYTTAEALEQGWLASPSHRANILDKRFTNVGIGLAQGKIEGYDSTVVVQLFAAPKIAATPTVTEPTPEPVPVTPTVEPVKEPVVDPVKKPVLETNVVLKDEQLHVEVKAPEATSVTGHVGESDIPFVLEKASGTWIGTIDPNMNEGTQEIYATAHAKNVEPETQLVGLVVANDDVRDLYRTQPNERVRVLGISIDGLGDSTRQFFLITLVVLFAILFLNIFIKFHIQRPTIIAHTVVVMGLALFFTLT